MDGTVYPSLMREGRVLLLIQSLTIIYRLAAVRLRRHIRGAGQRRNGHDPVAAV